MLSLGEQPLANEHTMLHILAYLFTGVIIILTALALWWYRLTTTLKLPGPPSRPIIGNLFDVPSS